MNRTLRLGCAALAAAVVPALGLANATAATTTTIRLAGTDRYGTSVAVSKQIEKVNTAAGIAPSPLVVIASGENFPDGLSAAVPAAFGHSRVLLVPKSGTLPASVKAELQRLNVQAAVVVGSAGAVSDDMVGQVGALGIATTRVAGRDRYETAAAVAQFAAAAKTLVVASGENFPDGLSSSAAAVTLRGPLLLTGASSLPASTAAVIKNSQATQIVVAGSSAVVSDAVLQQIKAIKPTAAVYRESGATRYSTAAAMSRFAFPNGAKTVYLASGRTFADALSAGAGAGNEAGPLLLSEPNCVPVATLKEIDRLGATDLRVVGGPSVLSANVANRVSCGY